MKAVAKTSATRVAGISEVCSCFNQKRDAYYKYQNRQRKRIAVASKVINLVKDERKDQPRVGTRKLYEALQDSFCAAQLKIGRDSLFGILRDHNMLVKSKKVSCRTTNSYHRFYSNRWR